MKNRKGKNVYVYYENEEYQYRKVEAVDDSGHTFTYIFTQTEHELYLEQVKEMLERFELFCTKTCKLKNCLYDTVWLLPWLDVIKPDFGYDTLFGRHRGYGEKYDRIFEDYCANTLERILGRCRWALVKELEFSYSNMTSHIKKPMTFKSFCKKYGKNHAGGEYVKAIVSAYKRLIDKQTFTNRELENIADFVGWNLNAYLLLGSINKLDLNLMGIKYDGLFMSSKLSTALTRLFQHDKSKFDDCIKNVCSATEHLKSRIDSRVIELVVYTITELREMSDKPYMSGKLVNQPEFKMFGCPEDNEFLKNICKGIKM